jgi:hypothetical protein
MLERYLARFSWFYVESPSVDKVIVFPAIATVPILIWLTSRKQSICNDITNNNRFLHFFLPYLKTSLKEHCISKFKTCTNKMH